MFIDSSGMCSAIWVFCLVLTLGKKKKKKVVERISEDMILISDQHDERVLRLGVSASSASSAPASSPPAQDFVSGSTPLDEEDDSPLLFRKDERTVLYGGEEIVLAVTQVWSDVGFFFFF